MLSFSKAVLCAIILAKYAAAAPAAVVSSSFASSATAPVSTAAASSAFASASSAVSSAFASASSEAASSDGTLRHKSSSIPASSSAPTSSSTPSSTLSAAPEWETVAPASDDPNGVLWTEDSTSQPEGIRGTLGSNILGPQNIPIALQNPDLLAPPSTDSGSVANAKWPFALSHNRLQTGGWARQQNAMAGVNMRLEAGAIRELHWHKTAEWSYVIKGSVQVTAINSDGQNYLGTASAGDLWYFPPGIPHSLQATDDDPDGTEFLLVRFSSAFGAGAISLTMRPGLRRWRLTDWLAHVPKEWHPTQDEWAYYLEGEGRVTLFASESNARTFNYQAGDVGFVPASFGHYVENIGNTTLRFLEIFNTDRYQDISLQQWLALTPPDLVKAHLGLDDETISHLSKTKYTVVGPA
ncbi:Bicupin, oxalate decarboxylase/oxidase [Trametes sanguinea]|nr:Bicupin, oxalate decarboxylase/oxidase [Trametes sanguinea]